MMLLQHGAIPISVAILASKLQHLPESLGLTWQPWLLFFLKIVFAMRVRGHRRLSPPPPGEEDEDSSSPGGNPVAVSWSRLLAVLCYHLVVLFFLHSVASYFALLRAEKRRARRDNAISISSGKERMLQTVCGPRNWPHFFFFPFSGYPSSEMITFSVSSRPSLHLMEGQQEEEEEEEEEGEDQHNQARSQPPTT